MKIFINKISNIIFLSGLDVVLNHDNVSVDGRTFSMDPDTYTVLDILNMPNHFANGKFKYVDNKFEYINPEDQIVDKWIDIRNHRDKLLQESDILSGILWPDLWASKSDTDKTAWTNYRKTLRDIPETYTNPDEVVWPLVPGTKEPEITMTILPVANTAPTE